MPATIIDSTTAGPACAAAAWPVSTKMPVPMMAPMPSRVRSTGAEHALQRLVARSRSRWTQMGLVANSDMGLK